MLRQFDGEFRFADARSADNGNEFFHGANFLIFSEMY